MNYLPVQFGIDQFVKQADRFKGKRLAIVTNSAALTSNGIYSRKALLDKGFELVRLFSPEHGINLIGEDGSFQHDGIDELTGLPVISLYGTHFAPTQKDLEGIDLVLFDIPDVGCRFYTYLWTMTHVMESCAKYGKPFILLDRPNPISGDPSLVEGPLLDEEHCSSFIGRWSIPIRHSCTLGELATYFASTRIKGLELEVIQVENWVRNLMADEAGWEFVPTSPAIKDLETALLYPGMGLLEGINVNEGRGTDKPFKVCGAPWIDSNKLLEALAKKNIPGITMRAIRYKPGSGLYGGAVCQGLEFSVSDRKTFRPVAMGLDLIRTLFEVNPDKVEERLYKTVANPGGEGHLGRLVGAEDVFKILSCGEQLQLLEPKK